MIFINRNEIVNAARRIFNSTVNDLSTFLHISLELAIKETEHGCQLLCSEFEKWKGGREDFYRSENNCFLFDLAQLNTYESYWQERILPLGIFRNLNVLDFGCGIGSASLFMGELGNKVYGYDIGSKVLEFAKFRNRNSNVTFSSDLPELSQFDLVIALDVFEHVEDLHSLILQLGKMKAGTRLYHFDSFSEDHPHPLHYKRPQGIWDWFKEVGFININDRWAIKR